ncbi:MAG: L-lactate dehydrogenase [Methylobacteriaceae bacterium]|nr:L-lactate dehydrogenase [Methylobacteriaceae bacterium]
MKAGIIGVGAVGRAAALAAMQRSSASELVLVDRTAKVSQAVALDLGYGIPLGGSIRIKAGDYAGLEGAGIVVVTAGVNEQAGGATDRNDPAGRLRLLDQNVGVMQDVVPPLVAAAPDAVILIATDPPDPLTDVVRALAPNAKVFSTGTFLDSLRFRTHLADALGVSPSTVRADVLGEHGKSEVLHWSGAAIAGVPWKDVAAQRGIDETSLKARVDDAVRHANINIIEGIGASQYGIGIVIARLIEAVLRDEKLVIPVGAHSHEHGVTYSLPSVVGASGVESVFAPRLEPQEQEALAKSIATLQEALAESEASRLIAKAA